ncbi:hypothetical protein PENSPDRAFT_695072, partial [Peniophora sp. CONT]
MDGSSDDSLKDPTDGGSATSDKTTTPKPGAGAASSISEPPMGAITLNPEGIDDLMGTAPATHAAEK